MEFESLNTQVLAISTDTIYSAREWAKLLGGVSYPLLSDFWPHGAVAKKYGVLRENFERLNGHNSRSVFIVDPQGIVRYIDIRPKNEVHDTGELIEALRRIAASA